MPPQGIGAGKHRLRLQELRRGNGGQTKQAGRQEGRKETHGQTVRVESLKNGIPDQALRAAGGSLGGGWRAASYQQHGAASYPNTEAKASA
ncbi:hypothetical protein GCM10027175_08200 [Hymenobacter latericoloratus]